MLPNVACFNVGMDDHVPAVETAEARVAQDRAALDRADRGAELATWGRGLGAAGIAAGAGLSDSGILMLQRTIGNAAVGRILSRRRPARVEDPEVVRVRELKKAYRANVKNHEWADAALRLNAFSDDDIPKFLPHDVASLNAMRAAAVTAMPGWSGRVTDAIDERLEQIRVAALKKAYLQNLKDQDWPNAALRLNAFSDDDIPQFLPRDATVLASIRAAAVTAMPGWSSRVTDAIDAIGPDPWVAMSADARMLHVMEQLVDTYGFPVNGAAGLVGNLNGESSLIPSRIEGSAVATPMRSADFDDHSRDFTPYEVVNRSQHDKVGPKMPGIGIAQWTSKGRRDVFFTRGGWQILFDMDAQIAFLVDELTKKFGGRGGVNAAINDSAVTVQRAADVVLERFEGPADPEASRGARRRAASHAASLYNTAHPPTQRPAP